MKLLLLAGTAEAREIADGLAAAGTDVVASLAGAVRAPRALAVPMRIGGFGGEDGFRRYLAEEGIGAVLDATHPFAARISARTARVCRELGMPHAQLMRPEWALEPGWVSVRSEDEVARHVPPGAVVFLATGRQTAARFHGLAGRRVICRVVDEQSAPVPFEGGEWLVARPPFSVADEVALFERLGVEWLVAKNAGGEAGRAKLEAARGLGINVAMIARPAPAVGETLPDVAAALDWVRGLG